MDDSFDFYDKTYNTILNLAVSKIYESSLALNKLNRLPIDDGNYYAEIFYLSTETWAEAIANHISRNRTWEIEGGRLKHNTYYLQDDGGNDIDSSTSPNSSGTYKWSDQ